MSFRKIGYALVALAVAVSLGACAEMDETMTKGEQAKVEKALKRAAKKTGRKTKKAEPTETVAQQNARESAETYLDMSSFSREGLIKQLKFEGFSQADATYAIEYLDPNWNKEAAEGAKSYLDMSSFSASGLQEQLEFEGFTTAQAAHGVEKAGL